MNKEKNLRINYTQVIAKRKEVGEKYDKQRARKRGYWYTVFVENKEESFRSLGWQ